MKLAEIKEALEVFRQAQHLPGSGDPELGVAHILLLRDALQGKNTGGKEALKELSLIDADRQHGWLRSVAELYRQVAFAELRDPASARAALERACDSLSERQIHECTLHFLRRYKTAALSGERRIDFERLYLFSKAEYERGEDPEFLAAMIDALGYLDFPRAVALEHERLGHSQNAAARKEYCEMVGELSSNSTRFKAHRRLVAVEHLACTTSN